MSEREIRGREPVFGGERWDMADFMVACVLCVLTRLKLDLTAYPKLDVWLEMSTAAHANA
jgi:glutathione S-transferase